MSSQLVEVAGLVAKLLGVVVALLFAYAVAVFGQHIWRLRGFKGPLAVPVLGNAWNPRIIAFMRFLIELRQKYGPIFTFFALMQGYLVCADPVIVRRILSDPKTFTKGSSYRDYFHIVFGDGLVTSNGEKHKADRAIFGKYFIRSNINRYVPRINEMARNAVKDLEKKYKEDPVQNVEKFFAVLALHVFMNLACSCDFPREGRDLEYAKLISKGSYLVGQLIGLGLPLWDIIPQVNYLRRHKEKEFQWYSGFVEDRKAALARGEVIDDILTAMLTNNLSKVEIGDHLTTMISAGHDTTTFFLSYFCYLVARNQDVQDRVRAELFEVFGDSEEVTPEAITGLKYLPKVMMETLRMYAVIPSITRLATEDITFPERNITIRKGTEVIIPLYIMNRDPELWDNPADFNPDRFDDKADYTSASKGFFPFAYGTRTCIGNTLAQIESSIFLAHILRKFRLFPADGYKPDIRAGISLTTSNGVKVKLEPL